MENKENHGGKPGVREKLLKEIGRGEILISLQCNRFFPHIIYTFFLICLVLVLNLAIEKTMVRAERNKQELYDMKIFLTHKNARMIGLEKLSTVEEMLKESGSDLGIPDRPATILER